MKKESISQDNNSNKKNRKQNIKIQDQRKKEVKAKNDIVRDNKKTGKKTKDQIPPKKEKKLKKKIQILRIILLMIILTIIILSSILGYRTIKNGGGLQGFLSALVGQNEDTLKNLPKLQVLVLGESQNLTDTIMVCSYDPKTQQASLLSIPRDTFIGKNKNRATAFDKINAVYQRKNADKILNTINELLDMNIKYYVTIDTKALIKLVDAIGGVEFDVPINMKYDDVTQNLHINLKAGKQKLNGQQAEWLVRFRHNNNGSSYSEEYGDNDIGRMRTQREFIQAVLTQTLKPHNITKIGNILDIAKEDVRTNIDFKDVKDYIPYAVNFKTENLKTGVLPGVPEKCNGVWLYIHDKTETKQLKQELFAEEIVQDDQQQDVSKKIKVEILNGTENKSKLEKLIKLLEEQGYEIVKTGNTTSKSKTSIRYKSQKQSEEAKELKEILGVGVISQITENSNVDIKIVIGRDYK